MKCRLTLSEGCLIWQILEQEQCWYEASKLHYRVGSLRVAIYSACWPALYCGSGRCNIALRGNDRHRDRTPYVMYVPGCPEVVTRQRAILTALVTRARELNAPLELVAGVCNEMRAMA